MKALQAGILDVGGPKLKQRQDAVDHANGRGAGRQLVRIGRMVEQRQTTTGCAALVCACGRAAG